MVQQCCAYVEEITDLPTKLRLIDTLRMVTEGKVSCVLAQLTVVNTLLFVFRDTCMCTHFALVYKNKVNSSPCPDLLEKSAIGIVAKVSL